MDPKINIKKTPRDESKSIYDGNNSQIEGNGN